MSRNRFEQIWCYLHFSNNELLQHSTNRLFKIQLLLDFFLERFQTIHKPNQQLSLNEAVIQWRGRHRIRTYNPGKLIKYGLLLDFKLPPCSECCESNFGLFSGVCKLFANVSELGIRSIFKGELLTRP